jgi:hypothetical protein
MKKIYRTISPAEISRWEKLDIKNLHYYQQLFQKIITGRKADLEFFVNQTIITDFVLDEKVKDQILYQISFFTERLWVINSELDRRAMNKLETSIN